MLLDYLLPILQDSIITDKGGITPEEDHEDLTTSWKFEGRSESVVKMKPFSGLQDHSTS